MIAENTESNVLKELEEGFEVFDFYGNKLAGPEFLASVFTLLQEHKCPFCKARVKVSADGESNHVWKCKANPKNLERHKPRKAALRISPENYARAQEYAQDMGCSVNGALDHALEYFFATVGLAERECEIERAVKKATNGFSSPSSMLVN